MKFTLRQLEFYIALAETLQISKAASRCHISQSSMTVSMRNLEDAVNAPLFIRHAKGIQLTPVGERFLNHARKILHDSRAAVEDLHQQPEAINGVVRIGIAETLSAYLLPDYCGAWLRRSIAWHKTKATLPDKISVRARDLACCRGALATSLTTTLSPEWVSRICSINTTASTSIWRAPASSDMPQISKSPNRGVPGGWP